MGRHVLHHHPVISTLERNEYSELFNAPTCSVDHNLPLFHCWWSGGRTLLADGAIFIVGRAYCQHGMAVGASGLIPQDRPWQFLRWGICSWHWNVTVAQFLLYLGRFYLRVMTLFVPVVLSPFCISFSLTHLLCSMFIENCNSAGIIGMCVISYWVVLLVKRWYWGDEANTKRNKSINTRTPTPTTQLLVNLNSNPVNQPVWIFTDHPWTEQGQG